MEQKGTHVFNGKPNSFTCYFGKMLSLQRGLTHSILTKGMGDKGSHLHSMPFRDEVTW